MRRVLVTGGTGMIGSALVRRLVSEHERVFVFVRPGSSLARLEGVEGEVRVCPGDVRHAETVRAAVEVASPDVVYHLASTPFNPPTISAAEHYATIVMGALNVLEALKDRPRTRVVLTGSAAEYGSGSGLREDQPTRPATVLGAAKASATALAQTYARLSDLQAVILRLFMPYGPGEHPKRLVPHVILSALEGRDVSMTLGQQERDLVYLEDVVEALLLAGTKPVPAGSVFNIGSGIGMPVKQVVALILRLMGDPVKPLIGAIPMRPDEIMEMSADISAAKTQLGWAPRVSLEDGLRRMIAWVTAQPEVVGVRT